MEYPNHTTTTRARPVWVAGVDFTSAPSAKKAISIAFGRYQAGCLHLLALEACTNWPQFEAFLAHPAYNGQWCDWLALDFPFSLPWGFLTAVDWPTDWDQVMTRLATMTKPQFESWIQTYCDAQPTGHKFHYRPTDRFTRSSSPMKLFYPPVGKMLFQGAVRLHHASHLSVLPFRPLPQATQCVEGYPALVARHGQQLLTALHGEKPTAYKTENRLKNTTHTRQQLLTMVLTPQALAPYGITQLTLPPPLHTLCLNDASGDRLDAVFCAIQAAWASQQPYGGIPLAAQEGWIVDPSQQAYAQELV
jgi:hypothetical protein